jgi:hypothetical protein
MVSRMAKSTFAGWKGPRTGPWEDWEDAKILDDFYYGCEVHLIAFRVRRSPEPYTAHCRRVGWRFSPQAAGSASWFPDLALRRDYFHAPGGATSGLRIW